MCARPRIYDSRAERQKAYRERKDNTQSAGLKKIELLLIELLAAVKQSPIVTQKEVGGVFLKSNTEEHLGEIQDKSAALKEAQPLGGHESESGARAKEGICSFSELIEKWNLISGVLKCQRVTNKRKQIFAARLKTPGWKEDVPEALKKLAASDFCRGLGKDGWRADIDFFLRPDTVAKIIEGKYDSRSIPRPGGQFLGIPEL